MNTLNTPNTPSAPSTPASESATVARLAAAQFAMLRYETEFTPCTGITAVTRQERRHFERSITIAPWCGNLRREKPEQDPLSNGSVRVTPWTFDVGGHACRVLESTDSLPPILFLDVAGRFRGQETPYDTPSDSSAEDSLVTLRRDALYFGLAVRELLRTAGWPQLEFLWGADWETAPALALLRDRYHLALTIHNTFDENLAGEAAEFGDLFSEFKELIAQPDGRQAPKTALQVGLEKADVATTVNRGFARGVRTEPLQRFVMAQHLQPLLDKVVGINNAAFRPLDQELLELRDLLDRDFQAGRDRLYQLKETHRQRLPERIRSLADDKVLVVGMGRRVMQKLHDVLVASVRDILRQDPRFPLLVIFATVHGDANSPLVLERIRELESEFPHHVVCEDGRIDYYPQLMAAADYNCMPSLYEPHGGAYEGTALPIARAVDGLAEQIRGYNPSPAVRAVSDVWHAADDPPTGLLYREDLEAVLESSELRAQLEAILQGRPFQPAFDLMRDALTPVLREAVELRLRQPDQYASMVRAALHKQEGSSWHDNLRQMLELMKTARTSRSLT